MPSRKFLAPPVLLIVGIALALTIWCVTSIASEGGGGLISGAAILLTLSFYAFGVPTVIILVRGGRRGEVSADASDGAPEAGVIQRPRRVTRIGWIALALSIAAPALFFLMGWGFNLSLEYAGQPDRPLVAEWWDYLFLAWVIDVLAATVVCTIAGTRGRGNRIVGVVGGLVLASPIALLFWVF